MRAQQAIVESSCVRSQASRPPGKKARDSRLLDRSGIKQEDSPQDSVISRPPGAVSNQFGPPRQPASSTAPDLVIRLQESRSRGPSVVGTMAAENNTIYIMNPPEGVLRDPGAPPDATALIAVISLLLPLAAVAVVIRLYTRARINLHVAVDDCMSTQPSVNTPVHRPSVDGHAHILHQI